jgi:DNA-binding NarL/FixJ family response regulator
MNILIVDDHPLVCIAIRNILISEQDIDNVNSANDIESALEMMSMNNYHLAIVDIRLKNESGINFIRMAKDKFPNCKYIILSSSSAAEDFDAAMQLNIDGYILKDAFSEDIVYAVKSVLRGRKYFDPIFLDTTNSFQPEQPAQAKPQSDNSIETSLSPREKEILKCLGEGMSNKNIADKLYISENTVKKHVSSILAKLGLSDRIQAALYVNKTYKTYKKD